MITLTEESNLVESAEIAIFSNSPLKSVLKKGTIFNKKPLYSQEIEESKVIKNVVNKDQRIMQELELQREKREMLEIYQLETRKRRIEKELKNPYTTNPVVFSSIDQLDFIEDGGSRLVP
jgi:hypothetical protein